MSSGTADLIIRNLLSFPSFSKMSKKQKIKLVFFLLFAIFFLFLSHWIAIDIKSLVDEWNDKNTSHEPSPSRTLILSAVYLITTFIFCFINYRATLNYYLAKATDSDKSDMGRNHIIAYYVKSFGLAIISLFLVIIAIYSAEEWKVIIDTLIGSHHETSVNVSGTDSHNIVTFISASFFTALTLVLAYPTFLLTESLLVPRTRWFIIRKPIPRKHLVLIISRLDGPREPFPKTQENLEKWQVEVQAWKDREGIPPVLKLSPKPDQNDPNYKNAHQENLDNDLRMMMANSAARYQWEMPLRAMKEHLPRLEVLYIFYSQETIDQISWFLNLISRYLNPSINIKLVNYKDKHIDLQDVTPQNPIPALNGWDYEAFDHLSYGINELVEELLVEGVQEEDISIDVTGGQKVTSVVAAIATINRKVVAQYVQTNDLKEVLEYDIVKSIPRLPKLE